jgi:zinc protease
MRNQKTATIAILLLVFLLPAAFAQTGDVTGLAKSVLPNGMEVFVLENHVVPLVRIQITFRCGGITQTPDTVGLFHLYEHMLFKGNRTFKNQSDFQAAMKELGVASWNGGTSTESVSYYFTVPADKLEKGISFWAEAVRYPLLDEAELETEKRVVINEIVGYINDPGNIKSSGEDKALFWKYPWRKDVGGYEKAIMNASVGLMRDIQDRYYIPNNAALFVGGDVDPKAALAIVEKYFGDWQKRADPWSAPLPPQAPLPKDVLLVYPDEQMYNGVAEVAVILRGPDVLDDTAATYAADVWGTLIADPNGKFKADIFAKVPGLYKKEYISGYYITQRDGGYIQFETYMLLSSGGATLSRAVSLRNVFLEETAAMEKDPSYFGAADYTVLKTKLGDQRVLERETVDGFIGNLSFWWATASSDYYLGYTNTLARTGFAELAKYLADYIVGKNSVLSVRINPEDFKTEAAAAEKAGFTVLTKDNAYWWGTK